MRFPPGRELLRVVDHVRGIQGSPPCGHLSVLGCDPDDERHCILACAMLCEVGGARSARWTEATWVMRFDSGSITRAVGLRLGLTCDAVSNEVALPLLLG